MDKLVRNFYRLLMLLSGLSMLAAFGAVTLGVFARFYIYQGSSKWQLVS